MDKEDVIHIFNGTLLNYNEEWNLAICDNTDTPRGYYAKLKKSDREIQRPHDFTYVWNLKNKVNEQTKKKLIDTEDKLVVTRWRKDWGKGEKIQIAVIKIITIYVIVIAMYVCQMGTRLIRWSLHKVYKYLITMLYTQN